MTRFGRESDLRRRLNVRKDEGFSPDFLAVKKDSIDCRLQAR